MKAHSTYTKSPITEADTKNLSDKFTYALNGGAKKLAVLIKQHAKKAGKSAARFACDAGVSTSSAGRYIGGTHCGITMGAIRQFAGGFGTSAFELSKQLGLTVRGNYKKRTAASKSTPSTANSAKRLDELMATLGVNAAESTCSLTVGNERITVERMPGQRADQPVVVEHNGHRLTVERV